MQTAVEFFKLNMEGSRLYNVISRKLRVSKTFTNVIK